MTHDLRFALRQLLKNRGFSSIAILTLAITIGSGTAVFSLCNAILLRSLPVPDPQNLRVLQWTGTDTRVPSLTGPMVTDGNRLTADCFSPLVYQDLREQAAGLADVFGFSLVEDFAIGVRDETLAANGMVVSDNFFSALGVRPLLGRLFERSSSGADDAQGIVLSWDWWQRSLEGRREAIGQTLNLKGQPFTILGILPQGFRGLRPGVPTDFYVLLVGGSPLLERPFTEERHWWIQLMARLRPGATDDGLRALLTGVFARDAGTFMTQPGVILENGHGGLTQDQKSHRKALYSLLGVVGMVMVVACANLAGLTLARDTTRSHELAIRAALGASRWQRARQAITESLVLSVLGGGLGVLLALWARTLIARLLTGSDDGIHGDATIDFVVWGFTLLTVVGAAILSGILPAIRAGQVDPAASLKERSPTGNSRARTGRILVAAQLALCLPLLSAAGLYVRSLVNLNRIDVGFRLENLLLFQLRPSDAGYKDSQLVRYYERVQNSLTALPGVVGVALIHYPLLGEQSSQGEFTLFGGTELPKGGTHRLLVSETFFATLGIPFFEGEGWKAGDTNAIVVNEAFVKRYLPGQSPIGMTMKIWGVNWRITGVCRDIKHRHVKEPTPPTTYFSHLGRVPPVTCYAVRTHMPPLELASTVRNAIAKIDSTVPATHLTTQVLVRDGSIRHQRLFAMVGGALAILTLLLSCLGLHGLMSHAVTSRRSEIAVRMAIGAPPALVARSILHEALVLTAIGAAFGIPLIWLVTRLFESQLFGVTPNDPIILSLVMISLAAVTLISAWLPARRASRVNPIDSLSGG